MVAITIQKFLGLANYYHQFIKNIAVIARPLHNMVKRSKVEMDRIAGEDIWRIEEEIHERTSANSTGLR